MSSAHERQMRAAAQRQANRDKIPEGQKEVAALHEIAELLNAVIDRLGSFDVRLQAIERNTAPLSNLARGSSFGS